MRRAGRVAIGVGVILVVVAAADLPLAYHGSSSLKQQKRQLIGQLARERSQGLPAKAADQLLAQVAAVNTAAWWSPTYLLSGQSQRISSIRKTAGQDWAVALRQARDQAKTYLTSYQEFVKKNDAWLGQASSQQQSTWSAQVVSARTPGTLESLVSQIQQSLSQAQSQVKAAQAKAASNVSVASAPGGLLQEAAQLEAIANSDNLSALNVPQDATALRQALAQNQSGTSQTAALGAELTQLRAEIGLNDQLISQSLSAMDLVDQAAAEQTPNSAAYLAAYQGSQQALDAAQTASQLAAVQQTLNTLDQETQQSLTSDQCGHTTIPGKSIYISLSLQEMVFYDNGCAVRATPVTTGRAQLRTPTGTFHIFDKQSPYVFISPWPPGSPFWYPTSPVHWVMEFDQGGYYIHDAPWEPTSVYGPNSQNGPDASHGCVQTPEATMQWAYGWTPMGTTVVVAS